MSLTYEEKCGVSALFLVIASGIGVGTMMFFDPNLRPKPQITAEQPVRPNRVLVRPTNIGCLPK